jgi:hypothetical protein
VKFGCWPDRFLGRLAMVLAVLTGLAPLSRIVAHGVLPRDFLLLQNSLEIKIS